MAISLGGVSEGNEASETIDRQIDIMITNCIYLIVGIAIYISYLTEISMEII